MTENLREIINGGMLPRFNGKKVSITGLVSNMNPNGLTFDIRAVDDTLVKINLRKPSRDKLSGYVEVHGVAQGSAVICDNLVQFAVEDAEEFNAVAHNTLCTFLQTLPNLWQTTA